MIRLVKNVSGIRSAFVHILMCQCVSLNKLFEVGPQAYCIDMFQNENLNLPVPYCSDKLMILNKNKN